VSVSGGRAVRGSFTNHPCPGRAVGKTDLVVVAVQGAPPLVVNMAALRRRHGSHVWHGT
jgi:hypothetical protein